MSKSRSILPLSTVVAKPNASVGVAEHGARGARGGESNLLSCIDSACGVEQGEPLNIADAHPARSIPLLERPACSSCQVTLGLTAYVLRCSEIVTLCNF